MFFIRRLYNIFFSVMLLFFFIETTVLVYAKQTSFAKIAPKSEQSNTIRYRYMLDTPTRGAAVLGSEFEVTFQLPEDEVKNNYTLIPNLKKLRQENKQMLVDKISPFIKNKNEEIESAFRDEIDALYENANKDGVIVDCPETLISIGFDYSVRGAHTIKTNIQGCRASGSSDDLFSEMIKAIETEVTSINSKLEYGSEIKMIKRGNSFSIQQSLTAPSESELKRMQSIFNEGMKDIQELQNSFSQKTNGIQANLNAIGRKQSALVKSYKSKLSQISKEIGDEFFELEKGLYEENYFVVEERNKRTTITLDFRRVVDDITPDMKSVAAGLREQNMGRREQIFKTMYFLQAIPYNTLEGRELEGYSGFLPPLALLDKNKGDCDTKSTALLSLLKLMYPDMATVMVLIPNHAFVGIEITPDEDDTTIEYEGKTYVVAEPVGPGVLKLGEPSTLSENFIATKNFVKIISIN